MCHISSFQQRNPKQKNKSSSTSMETAKTSSKPFKWLTQFLRAPKLPCFLLNTQPTEAMLAKRPTTLLTKLSQTAWNFTTESVKGKVFHPKIFTLLDGPLVLDLLAIWLPKSRIRNLSLSLPLIPYHK